MNKVIELKTGLKGVFTVRKYKMIDGIKTLIFDSGENENLIVNDGLDQIGTTSGWYYVLGLCRVGTGTIPPAPTDTGLGNVSLTNNSSSKSYDRTTVTPFYAFVRCNFVFNEGTGNHNLTEFGIFQSDIMFSRSLFKDAEGEPITITKLNEEILEIVYELRIYPPAETGILVGNFILDGETYDYYAYPYWPAWGAHIATAGTRWRGTSTYGVSALDSITNLTTLTLPTLPTISGTYGFSIALLEYTPGTYYRDQQASLGIDVANWSNGLGGFRIGGPEGGSSTSGILITWYIQFTPKIPKSSDNKLIITFRQSWGRKV